MSIFCGTSQFLCILFLLYLTKSFLVEGFTCQGSTYRIGLQNCPDKGTLKLSSGGNVTVILQRAHRLPNKDIYPTTSFVSDPYVEFTVGKGIKKRSSSVANSLNPNWRGERVNLGVLGSATEILVTIWDEDIGLEFSDDVIIQWKMRVPFCSIFNSSHDTVNCGQPFGCASDDSLWKMPRRPICRERGSLCTGNKCLDLVFEIIPFNFDTELNNNNIMTQGLPMVGAVGQPVSQTWSVDFGKPLISINNRFDLTEVGSSFLLGGLMMRFHVNDRYAGRANDILFYGSINFPAWIYVCRPEDDDAKGVPAWITEEYSDLNVSVTQLRLSSTGALFQCYYRYSKGTLKNKYGGVTQDYLTFRTNTIPNYDNNSKLFYSHMYTVIAVPEVISPRHINIEIQYDSAGFVNSFFQQGLICMWFAFIVLRYLKKVRYRLDRVMSHLVSLKYTGSDKVVLASIVFAIDQQTPCNIQFRGHLFHVRNMVYVFYVFPFLLLMSWGFSIDSTVSPRSLGVGICFVGWAVLCGIFGFKNWETANWRMTRVGFVSIGLSVIFFFIFIVSTVFVDPAVTIYDYPFDFTALSLVFGAINTMPLILLAFQRDKAYRDSLKGVITKMAEVMLKLKAATSKEKINIDSATKSFSINKALHGLLGSNYTLNPHVPMYKYAGILSEISAEKKNKTSEMESSHKLYRTSLFVLFVYLMIAVARTEYPSLAFLNCLALILLDTVHTTISHGDNHWSPGYHIFLLVIGRIILMGSSGHYWLLNYSLTYMIYAFALSQEIIKHMLPQLSKREAGEAVFHGESKEIKAPNMDMAGTPQFGLGILTYSFVSIVLVSAFSNPAGLPVAVAHIWNAEWQLYTFGLIAVCVVVVGALLSACLRSFYLEKHGLLRDWARNSYLLRKNIRLPIVLAIYTEIAVISSGILIFGATGSNAILTLAVFVPPIVVCFSYAYKVWVENDYDLVVWPPRQAKADQVDDAPTDMEAAFNMIGGLFGTDAKSMKHDDFHPEIGSIGSEKVSFNDKNKPELKTLHNFQLAPLKSSNNTNNSGVNDEAIKMPPLPLKSVLRKKRESMGIKETSSQLVDIHDVSAPEDSDKFGGSDVFVDANDPWAQFEADTSDEKEEEDANDKVQKASKDSGVRKHWLENETYLKYKNKWISSALGLWCIGQKEALKKFYQDRTKKSQPIHPGLEETRDENRADPEQSQSNKNDINRVIFDKADTVELGDQNSASVLVEETPSGETAVVAVPVEEMGFYYAALNGYLSTDEYVALLAWFGGMFLVMVMGCVLSDVVNPTWLGPTVWCAIWMFICAAVPIIKYFHTYTIDETMKHFIYFDLFFHFMFCICFFGAALDGNTNDPASLWILDFFFYYPIFVWLAIECYSWRDNGYIITAIDKDHDGTITSEEYFEYFKYHGFLVILMILFIWHLFDWISFLVGNIAVLIMLTVCIGYFFVRDWAVNDFYLSEKFAFAGTLMLNFILFITFMISLFNTGNPIFPLSVFFFCYILRHCNKLLTRVMTAEADTLIYFSPYVMPVFTYDPRRSDLVNESKAAMDFFKALIAGALWGGFLAMFLYPVSVGVCVACVFLLIIAAIVSAAVSHVPLSLGHYSSFLDHELIQSAANAAREKYEERKSPLDLEIQGYKANNNDREMGNKFSKQEKTLTSIELGQLEAQRSFMLLGKEKRTDKTALQLASELMDDQLALTHIRDDARAYILDLNIQSTEESVTWFTPYRKFFQKIWKFAEDMPMLKMKGWVRHSEALMTVLDATAECIVAGRGPYSFLGFNGLVYKGILLLRKKYPHIKYFDALLSYDEFGNRTTAVSQLTDHFDSVSVLVRLFELDSNIDDIAFEESRCGIHFLLLLTLAGQARLDREQVTVQKFFRENRFRLASNGITPPGAIFSSSSYASIDIPLVAVWLSTLTPEERERFHLLKMSFSEEQKKRDEAIDDEDYQFQLAASDLARARLTREIEQAGKIKKQMVIRQIDRVRALQDFLNPIEKQRFLLRKDEWLANADCVVFDEDAELYAKFRAAVMQHNDETTDYARQVLHDIESAMKDCRIGEYGRSYQFIDPEFSPGDSSLGNTQARLQIQNWKCAPGINEQSRLFDSGTDPDDVEMGAFKTDWLMSAISMLAAAGGVGDGTVDEQILDLFVGHYSLDGEVTFHTEVGGYCVKLFINGVWTPIILDDMFPMLKDQYWSNDNKGAASAHAKEFSEIWVPLVEKAFAKYYGSYGSIEKGYVHHALASLTGCEAECLTMANASRGPGKKDMWDKILRCRANGYLLGAGTGSSALVDKEILEMGIVFNACYVVYDVRSIDGQRLLKLRNPPGDHEEWKGDWSDKSTLWNKRLKKKLKWTDADDNTFWMSFDDFCNVFRNLYICRWYDTQKWKSMQFTGVWKKSLKRIEEEALEKERLKNEAIKKRDNLKDEDMMPEKEADLTLVDDDTSGGLPSSHNMNCILKNNPHYQLKIIRPTDIRITLNQTDSRGVVNETLLPVSLFLIKSDAKMDIYKRLPRIEKFVKDDIVSFSGPPKTEVTTHIYESLLPGDYIIFFACYVAGMEGHFTLKLLSNYKVKCKQLWPVPKDKDIDDIENEKKDQFISKYVETLKTSSNMLNNSVSALLGDNLSAAIGSKTQADEWDPDDPLDPRNIKDDIDVENPRIGSGSIPKYMK